jgi:hypothetical protein
MNFKRNFSAGIQNLVAVIVAVALVAACGGGGGGTAASSNILSGVASKGPLNGATVCAYAITACGVQGAQIGNCVVTDSAGNYSINLGTYIGPLLAQATGGTYVNEATSAVVPLVQPLDSVLPNAIAGTNSLAITALNELAYQNASAVAGGLTPANTQSAITTVQNNFGVADIVTTMPVDALNVPASATAAQKTYALALATVSQYQNSQPAGSTLATALQTIQTCLATPTTGCGTGSS